MKGRYSKDDLNCSACNEDKIESQAHVIACTGYADLRAGLDLSCDKDLVNYFSHVMRMQAEVRWSVSDRKARIRGHLI